MPNSTCSSSASANCRRTSVAAAPTAVARRAGAPEARIEWRPSRGLLAVIALLGMLGAFSVLSSEMPRAAAWLLAVASLAYAGLCFRRESRRPVQSFVLRGDAGPVLVDGAGVDGFELHWRGPLAFASWRDGRGRCQRRAWWPDTLPPARRRELRLAAPGAKAARRGASMAP